MPYTIECAESFSSENATEADINHAFDHDAERGEFIILTAPNGNFMQAAGDEDEKLFVVEHRNVATKEHIRVVGDLSKDEARKAFVQFLRGDESWRSGRQWEPLKTGGGCMKMIVLTVLSAAFVIYAIA